LALDASRANEQAPAHPKSRENRRSLLINPNYLSLSQPWLSLCGFAAFRAVRLCLTERLVLLLRLRLRTTRRHSLELHSSATVRRSLTARKAAEPQKTGKAASERRTQSLPVAVLAWQQLPAKCVTTLVCRQEACTSQLLPSTKVKP
jgi:hypothetical protein